VRSEVMKFKSQNADGNVQNANRESFEI
jgi:hypothetical protein